ncbi:MAG: AbrB/MazE/SpoVT family DNA-binding domain-containing protein [Myxococcaceae bacterium]
MKNRDGDLVRLSSKGQIVLPAKFRRKLGLVTGRVLRVTSQSAKQLVLSVVDDETSDVEDMLKRSREWARTSGRDLVKELQDRREAERKAEEMKRGGRGH